MNMTNDHCNASNLRKSIIQALRQHAFDKPDDPAFIFVKNKSLEDQTLSYSELLLRASSIAQRLKSQGCEKGQRALLVYPSGLDYVEAFLGCLMAGVVAVPVYPPANKKHIPRILAILRDCQPKVILSTYAESSRTEGLVEDSADLQGNITVLCTDNIETDVLSGCQFNDDDLVDIALLQYTSGSTGTPKGVVVTHANLTANQKSISEAFMGDTPGCTLGWLPLYHDMGLIGCVIQSVYWGYPYVFMSPFTFLQHPVSWLKAIHKYRAFRSGGPNFAYDLCASKLSDEQLEGVDLSSWKIAFCGSEPIRAQTLSKFSARFQRYGFDSKNFLPCYGLAEATLFVSGSQGVAGARVITLDSAAMHVGSVVTASVSDANTKVTAVVGSGAVGQNIDLRIVDPETRKLCEPNRIGEIWVNGPAVASGYWEREEISRDVFGARIEGDASEKTYLRTGDLGFCRDGELFVTGRCKELIIIGGKNYFPHDFETIAESASHAVRRSHSAAISIENGSMTEGLALVCEVERIARSKIDFDIEAKSIATAINTEFGVAPKMICFMRPGGMLKTSSGKIQRSEIRHRLLDGSLEAIHYWPTQPGEAQRIELFELGEVI
ncbi:MAG: fatty acyl-AMP ligase [Burkholderiales bacterium]|nr:fatty acyl-AMP ligase [Anaerolineae bacterium]